LSRAAHGKQPKDYAIAERRFEGTTDTLAAWFLCIVDALQMHRRSIHA